MTHFDSLEPRALLATSLADASIYSVAVQSDSKIIVAGFVGPRDAYGDPLDQNFFVARFNANGSLDGTFGDGGTVVTDFGGNDSILDVKIDSHGRIVAAGAGGVGKDFAVARYLPDGSLDASFNGGKRLIAFGGDDRAQGVAITSDDKVVLVGYRSGENLSPTHAVPVARLNANGSFDSTLSGDGTALLSLPSEHEFHFHSLADVAISQDGKILITGGVEHLDAGVAFVGRLLSDGSFDSTFGYSGLQIYGDDDSWGTQIVEPTPGVLVVATDHVEIPFDSFVITDNGANVEEIEGPSPGFRVRFATLTTQNGRVTVAGWKDDFSNNDETSFVARYVPEGSQFVLDNSLDGDGLIDTKPSFYTNASALDPRGRLVVVRAQDPEFVIARYQANGQPDATFNGNGIVRTGSATVSGRVFNDLNANGIFDGSDTGISGFRVFLDEAPFNGAIDPGELSKPVSGTGTYTFSNVPSDTYRVRVASREGWRQSSPALGYYEISIDRGQIARSLSFACADTIVIKGNVFMDANKSRVRDAGEAGLSGWYVYIDRNNDGVIDKNDTWTQSDANGNYRFFNLAAGTYTIRVVSNVRYRQTAPASGYHRITLGAGGSISNRNFGLKRIA
jgi:uncharacterized delta-60 repeat protein